MSSDDAPTDSRPPRQALVPPAGLDLHGPDLTATFAADVPLRVAQARLGELNQWLPIDGDPGTALGRLVETNSTGPLRLGYAAWRDLLLGLQFTNGRGELISAGGRTVKNVAGYDLTKFMVGQQGVFGRIVTITARTWRRPDGALAARFPPDASVVGRLLPTPLRPQWAMLLPDALWCGYHGDEAALEFYRNRLSEAAPAEVLSRTLEEDGEHRMRFSRFGAGGAAPVFRASVPPARLAGFAAAAGAPDWAADAAFGIVVGETGSQVRQGTIRDAAEAAGGRVTFFGSPAGSPSGPPAFDCSTTPAERRIIERLKQAFDPDGTLTPLPWQTR